MCHLLLEEEQCKTCEHNRSPLWWLPLVLCLNLWFWDSHSVRHFEKPEMTSIVGLYWKQSHLCRCFRCCFIDLLILLCNTSCLWWPTNRWFSSPPLLPEVTFWFYVKEHLNRHELQRFYSLRHISSELGRGRAWLRCALNEHSLERYLHTLLADRQRLGSVKSLLWFTSFTTYTVKIRVAEMEFTIS